MSEFENFNDPNIYIDFESTTMTTVSVANNYIKLLETFHLLFNKNIVRNIKPAKTIIFLFPTLISIG